jgi:anti-anti-sigma factor
MSVWFCAASEAEELSRVSFGLTTDSDPSLEEVLEVRTADPEPVNPSLPAPEALSPVHLWLRVLRCGRTVWLQLGGVLNWRTAREFRQGVAAALAGPCRRLVIDLTGVEYVGGNGLRALQEIHDQLSATGTELRLVVPEGSRCARSMALTGLDATLLTFAHPEQAWRWRPTDKILLSDR